MHNLGVSEFYSESEIKIKYIVEPISGMLCGAGSLRRFFFISPFTNALRRISLHDEFTVIVERNVYQCNLLINPLLLM